MGDTFDIFKKFSSKQTKLFKRGERGATTMAEHGISAGSPRGLKALLIPACVIALLVAIWAAGGPIGNAQAASNPFCNGYNAAPYGQPGDRCSDGSWFNPLNGVVGKGVNHSACVDAENTGGGLITSWACSGGPEVEVSTGTCCSLGTLRGVVRNNTTGDTNHLYGWDLY